MKKLPTYIEYIEQFIQFPDFKSAQSPKITEYHKTPFNNVVRFRTRQENIIANYLLAKENPSDIEQIKILNTLRNTEGKFLTEEELSHLYSLDFYLFQKSWQEVIQPTQFPVVHRSKKQYHFTEEQKKKTSEFLRKTISKHRKTHTAKPKKEHTVKPKLEHKVKPKKEHTSEKEMERRRKISETLKGHTVSDESIEKMRIAHLGKKQTAEEIEKRIAPLRGRKRSPETIAKMKASRRGKLSEEHKKSLSIAHTGKTLSPEHKEKISESMKRYREQLRQTNSFSNGCRIDSGELSC